MNLVFMKAVLLYYKNNSKQEFKPFTPLDVLRIAIRRKAVSQNWYEVFINEESKETKYIWIGDSFLQRDEWEKYIRFSPYVLIDSEKNPLWETQDGQVKTVQISKGDWFIPKLIDGDWLRVQRKPSKGDDSGWIRWRKDNEIVIGFELNNWVISNK